jgi:ribosome-associated toxin RatA of RatAB toxin-antitoxin module
VPSLTKSVLLPYAASEMFDLVERVEDYPEFLPWCPSTEVERIADGMIATIGIRFKGIGQSFTTRNRHDRPVSIDMELVDGPFRRLEGRWRFHELAPDACKVEFTLDYEIAGGLLGRALSPVFGQIASTFVDAFVKRAEALHKRAR